MHRKTSRLGPTQTAGDRKTVEQATWPGCDISSAEGADEAGGGRGMDLGTDRTVTPASLQQARFRVPEKAGAARSDRNLLHGQNGESGGGL